MDPLSRQEARLPRIGHILLLTAALGFFQALQASSAGAEKTSAQEQLSKSLQIWNDLKVKCGGNYSYKVRWENRAGFGHETSITVRTNQVIERTFTQWSKTGSQPGTGSNAQAGNYIERDLALGTHKKGSPAKTLDELYLEAEKVLKAKYPSHMKMELSFDKKGLLQACCYVDIRYAEDAPRKGVILDSIQLDLSEK